MLTASKDFDSLKTVLDFFFKLCVNGSNSATVNQFFFFYKFYWQSLSYRLFIMALSCCFFLEAVMFVSYVNFVRGHTQAL